MEPYRHCIIKSFKHNGYIHRIWQQNWLLSDELLAEQHKEESMKVLINRETPIQESDGKIWISRVPAVSFFIPEQWFNVVALLEDGGIRYYCNIASPPYMQGNVLTYIDYDLDVIRTVDGGRSIVDQDEYEIHKAVYHYPKMVDDKVRMGLEALLLRIDQGQSPFQDELIIKYYEDWLKQSDEVEQ